MNSRIIIVTLLAICASCSRPINNNFDKTQWIIGTWVNQTSNGLIYETWSPVDKQEMQAKSYTLQGNDTILFETIQLIQKVDGLFYIPTVANQNEAQPIPFSLKTMTDNSWVFENLAHDFPQRIAYQQIDADSLIATISGSQRGKEQSINFPMRRLE